MQDFYEVTVPISKAEIKIVNEERKREFFANCAVVSISVKEKKEKENKEEDEDVETLEDLIYQDDEEDIAAEDKPDMENKEQEKDLTWQKRQRLITSCIIELRKAGGRAAKIERRKGDIRRIILFVEGMTGNTACEIVREYGKSVQADFIVQEMGHSELTGPELIRLLFGLLPYRYADIPVTEYPWGGYQVMVKLTKKEDEKLGKPAKYALLIANYSDDNIISCDVKQMFECGDWMKNVTDDVRKKSEDRAFFHMATGKDRFLTRSADPDGPFTDTYRWSKNLDRNMIENRSLEKVSEKQTNNEKIRAEKFLKHEESKQLAFDHLLYRFNESFGSFLTLTLKTWTIRKHWSEVGKKRGNITGENYIKEQNMVSINRVRRTIEEYEGLCITESSDVQRIKKEVEIPENELAPIDKNEKKKFETKQKIAMETDRVRKYLADMYLYAEYKLRLDMNTKLDGDMLIIPALQGNGSYEISAVNVVYDKKTFPGILEDGCFVFRFPKGVKGIAIYIKFAKDYDMPLHAAESFVYKKIIAGKEKEGSTRAEYNSGFGVRNGTVRFMSPSKEYAHIELIPDNKDKSYIKETSLSVQHLSLVDANSHYQLVSENETKCQKTFFELAIKMAILEKEIECDGVTAAFLSAYVPSKGKRKACHKYYLFDGEDIRWVPNNKDKLAAMVTPFFPEWAGYLKDLERDNFRANQYFIKTDYDTYYMDETNLVPLGTSELNEDGILEKLQKKGTDVLLETVPASFGVSFHDKTEGEENTIYYCSAGSRYAGDVQQSIARFSHFYEVHHENEACTEESLNDLYKMLTDTMVKMKRYTTVPSIIKYMREWAKVSGRRC